MKEIKSRRDRFGGADDIAINRHHIRVYLYAGIEFVLDRTMDGIPPSYNLYYFGNAGSMTTVLVKGEEYWGDSLSWEQAEALAKEAIKKPCRKILALPSITICYLGILFDYVSFY